MEKDKSMIEWENELIKKFEIDKCNLENQYAVTFCIEYFKGDCPMTCYYAMKKEGNG